MTSSLPMMPLHGLKKPMERARLKSFKLKSAYEPAGDQPQAIEALTQGLLAGKRDQALLGVTGSGKTFTMAQVIHRLQRPALILAHNKTLAAQLYSEMKGFFPENAVEYFVSYYDYYQPEAYVAKTDTYIEKDSAINERIELMRHSATRSLLERKDVIVVSSVSCIYGIGSPELYSQMTLPVERGGTLQQSYMVRRLVELSYSRNDIDFKRGTFRVRGDSVDVFPAHCEDRAWRFSFFGDEVDDIREIDALTGETVEALDDVVIFANSHYVTPRPTLLQMLELVKAELKVRLKEFEESNKLLEAQRLDQRTTFDLEMIRETGACKGIENYSRYLSGRKAGEPPPTLFEYLSEDALLFVDESHVTVPQIGAMYNGDQARKSVLVEHGFRLPSAKDNRPLKFAEWDAMRPQTVYVSATPGKFELERTEGEIVEQVIRPTGLPDPVCTVRPVASQVDDLMREAKIVRDAGMRVLATTLTKRMAEDLTDYLQENGLSVAYMHSDVETLDRIETIRRLRIGEFDILVGVNLLREGLDIPECGLVAILDADKEGFLRSETSLIQTIGRAARNSEGRVVLYADKMTRSLESALRETERRRAIQLEHNRVHGVTPKTVNTAVMRGFDQTGDNAPPAKGGKAGRAAAAAAAGAADDLASFLRLTETKRLAKLEELKKKMLKAASDLNFEEAIRLREQFKAFEDAALKW